MFFVIVVVCSCKLCFSFVTDWMRFSDTAEPIKIIFGGHFIRVR